MINTFFENKINTPITYSSDGRESQIDLLVCKKDHLEEVRNCKVINGESLAAQQSLVVIDCRLRNCMRRKKKRMDPKIKWWKLKEEELRVLFKEIVLEEVRLQEDVQEWWTENRKDARGMEKKPYHFHLQEEGRHPGMWELQRHIADKPYYENMGEDH
ncbi:uncharacterized protein [Palaemon carinicauda]|uniref:uncharacterized protein n=1 Tax=Palaemon carinicauda TaxID=392227 RepID=UPI0035B5B623